MLSYPFRSFFFQTTQDQSMLSSLIRILQRHTLIPVVIFAFSRKRCESSAFSLKGIDLNTALEQREVFI